MIDCTDCDGSGNCNECQDNLDERCFSCDGEGICQECNGEGKIE